ncbi:hypothetical protein HYY75_13015 [bacterium]|nr:hypothetical protein [bacterium]
MFFLIFQCFPVLGCLNFAHEWTVIATGTYDSTGNVFALSNAFFQFKEEFGKQSSSKNHASETISVAGVFWGEKSEPASGDQIDCFQRAINLSWGPDRIIIDPGKILMTDDSEKFLEAARNGKTPLSATVHVKKFASDQLVLLDLIFFNWALLRTVFREELTMTVQVVDRAGDLVFLDEFNVSPTILTDTMLSPSGNYLTYFEKHDCQPWILDFGELFQNVASSTYSARSQMFRMPDIPSSIPMASPLFKDAPPEKQ